MVVAKVDFKKGGIQRLAASSGSRTIAHDKSESQESTLTFGNAQKMHGLFIFLLGLLCNPLKTMEPSVGLEPTTY